MLLKEMLMFGWGVVKKRVPDVHICGPNPSLPMKWTSSLGHSTPKNSIRDARTPQPREIFLTP